MSDCGDLRYIAVGRRAQVGPDIRPKVAVVQGAVERAVKRLSVVGSFVFFLNSKERSCANVTGKLSLGDGARVVQGLSRDDNSGARLHNLGSSFSHAIPFGSIDAFDREGSIHIVV